jgi:long-chain acyl-CoA synthetase
VLSSLLSTWKVLGLKSIEKISNVALYPDEWTPDNNWLTAAMKLKRYARRVVADVRACVRVCFF